MASITTLTGSGSTSSSSIYGNRNVLSGLASGMDTETMIENAVSGYKTKISRLQQQYTKVEWQQEAYRSIIDKLANFNTKYTSYTSKTNLLSSSFFSSSVITSTQGTNASKVTATGKTTSDIQLNAVKQMATAASYTVSGLAGQSVGKIAGVEGGKNFDISGNMTVSNVSGTLTFQYGGTNGTTFDIKFDELEDLDEMEGSTNAEKLANAINQKLSEVTYNYTKNGFAETTTADKAIKAVANPDGRIVFVENELKNGNDITISSSSGKIKSVFGLGSGDDKVLTVGNTSLANHDVKTYQYLVDKELSVSLNGTTKKISLENIIKNTEVETANDNQSFMENLQKELDSAFGKDTDGTSKVTVSQDANGKLIFTPSGEGSVLTLSGTAVKAMGFESGDSNYINTGKKLTALLGDQADSIFSEANRLKGTSAAIRKTSPNGIVYYVDSKGNRVDEDGYRVDADGKAIYDLDINGTHINVTEDTTLESLISAINANADAGVKVSYSKLTNEFKFTATETGANSKIEFGGLAKALFGNSSAAASNVDTTAKISDVLGASYNYGSDYANFTMKIDGTDFSVHVDENSTMDSIVADLNDMLSVVGSQDAQYQGVQASFDSSTNTIVFTDQNGNTVESSYGSGIASDLFSKLEKTTGAYYTAGQDAIMDVTVNGVTFQNLTRSSNTFDIDGLTITVKGTFTTGVDADGNAEEPVTFNTVTDSDKIVEAIASMINDYNEMITELKNAYSTQPLTNSSGNRYEPLTAEQEEGYSESELNAYNEKAKTGILYMDSNLSSLYSKLLNCITPGGTDGQTLREIGITTSYSNGLTTLTLDEDALRNALDSDPDKVKSAFTKTAESGSSSDGLMQTMQNVLNTYAKTTGEPKGVLIVHAGSVKAPTSLNSNTLNSQMNSIQTQIERWQEKMSDQIDRYTTKFSKLEQLIAEMNSQSSALMGLMGGGTSY